MEKTKMNYYFTGILILMFLGLTLCVSPIGY
jgi:hypothetical protein